jgi:undecaprenyl-diphosphatase
MHDLISSIIPTLGQIGFWGYWLVLLISFLESLVVVGSFFPGTIVIVFAGFLVSEGTFHFGNLVFFAALGAVLGDSLSYYLGTKGTRFFHNENKLLKQTHIDKGEEFFKKHGNKSILMGRFIGIIRPIIPFIAGLSKMRTRSFLFWNILSALLWSIAYAGLGFFFGGTWGVVRMWSARAGFLLFALITISLVLWTLLRYSIPFFKIVGSLLLSFKEAAGENENIKRITKKYPTFFQFLKRRSDLHSFRGLPFTLIGLLFVYFFFVLTGVAEEIINAGPIAMTDIRIENLIYMFRDAEMLRVFLFITYLGNWQTILVISTAFLFVFFISGKRSYFIPFIVSTSGATFVSYIGKVATHRPRPELSFYLEKGYSFPSGHATIAVAFYGFIGYFIFQQVKKWEHKIAVIFFTLLTILLIGFSRLYLGVHFFSDVWGGFLLGTLWLLIGISLTEIFKKKNTFLLGEHKSKKHASILICTIITTTLCFYAILATRYQPEKNIIELSNREQIVTDNILKTFEEKKLPKFSETPTGNIQEPLNVIFVAQNDDQLIDTLEQAGWRSADPINPGSLLLAAKAMLENKEYKTAPMTPTFWNTKVPTFGFQKPTQANTIRERHHFRIWKTDLVDQKSGYAIYVGTGSFDKNAKWGPLTHAISPDIDTERQYLFDSLNKNYLIKNFQKEPFVTPEIGKNFSGDQFFTDGNIFIIFRVK